MKILHEGEKRAIRVQVTRNEGTGAITLTSPQRRILSASFAVIANFDWDTATWDSNSNRISTTFDSTATGLTSPGTYYVQFRGVIGAELYASQVVVVVKEWGP